MSRTDVRIPSRVDKAWCDQALDYDAIPQFRKTSLTRAIRMDGPFTVETSEGPLRCEDGWLCFDARGYPYPVAADEFALIYEPALVDYGQRDVAYHPAIEGVLRFFKHGHLPEPLQAVARPFTELAHQLAARNGDGPETTVALRKLLEAKDAAVRAAL